MKKFCILITSYNNEKYTEQCLQSALSQEYTGNWRVIWVNDCSTDNNWSVSKNFVNGLQAQTHRLTMINNSQRVGAMENIYNSIHNLTQDDEIIVSCDGDDWLNGNQVLNKLNKIYSENNVWMTYGQYKNTASNALGHCREYPENIIRQNLFRSSIWNASHLRTYYSWLFKLIKKEDLVDTNGRFFQMTWDFAKMFPMLEMSGFHSRYIPEILYIYNDNNPICDHKVSRNEQARLDAVIRAKPKYVPLIENQISQIQQQKNIVSSPTTNKMEYIMYMPAPDFDILCDVLKQKDENEVVFGHTIIKKGK